MPIIETTGGKPPITWSHLETEEDPEAARAAVAQKPYSANIYLSLTPPRIEEAIQALSRKGSSGNDLGMPREIASSIVIAAVKGTAGVGVKFKTVFEEQGKIGGPRHYEGWEEVKPPQT